jgi:uncharacterized membrane-anchored protein
VRRVVALAAFQVLVLLGWAGHSEYVRATAPTFRIPLRPVDPHDVLRGRYFILSPEDGSLRTGSAGGPLSKETVDRFLAGRDRYAGRVLVGFCPDGELQRVCALAEADAEPPAGPARFWSRADVTISWSENRWEDDKNVDDPGWQVDVDLGLDHFFIPERIELPAAERDRGWEVEVCHRPGLTPLPLRLWYRGRPVWPRL